MEKKSIKSDGELGISQGFRKELQTPGCLPLCSMFVLLGFSGLFQILAAFYQKHPYLVSHGFEEVYNLISVSLGLLSVHFCSKSNSVESIFGPERVQTLIAFGNSAWISIHAVFCILAIIQNALIGGKTQGEHLCNFLFVKVVIECFILAKLLGLKLTPKYSSAQENIKVLCYYCCFIVVNDFINLSVRNFEHLAQGLQVLSSLGIMTAVYPTFSKNSAILLLCSAHGDLAHQCNQKLQLLEDKEGIYVQEHKLWNISNESLAGSVTISVKDNPKESISKVRSYLSTIVKYLTVEVVESKEA